MKVNKKNIFNEVKDTYRAQCVLDERVLQALADIDRSDFVPQKFRNFPYSDIEIPLGNKQIMLRPSIEGIILQSLNLKTADNILVVGSGSGYLSAVISKLSNKVDAVDVFEDFINLSQDIANKYNLPNIKFEKRNIINDWEIINNYNVVVFTFGIDNSIEIKKYLREYSRCFIFEKKLNFPMKSGLIIKKSDEENFTETFVTQAYTPDIIKC